MDRTSAAAATEAVRDALRQNPLFAGITDDALDQIAGLVSESTTQKVSEALRKVQLFEALSDDDMLRIQRVAETVALSPGEVLFEEGKKGDTFYVVVRGRVELFKRGRDGTEQKLAVAREGEAFGEMALLNQTPRSATARALEPTSLLEISREAFDSLLGGDSFPVRMLRGTSKALWAMSVRFASGPGKGGDAREVVRSLSQVMQKNIVPGSVPQVPGYSLMAQAGTPDKGAGESAWDWFRLGDGRVVLALMRAHAEGLPAGYPLLLARTLLRELGRDLADLGKLLARVNDALAGVAGATERVECALVALHEGELVWAGAGPISAAILRGGGTVVDLRAQSPALGAERGSAYRALTVPLMPGDAFLSVAAASAGALARGKAVAASLRDSDAREVVARLASALPAEDPVTGEVFENAILLLKCVDQALESQPTRVGAAGAQGTTAGA